MDYAYLDPADLPARQFDRPLNAVSVFSGAMGLDLGFELAGFDVRFACDIMPAACDTIRTNRPSLPLVQGDVSSVRGKEILARAGLKGPDLDLLIGGPPCQAFSTAGRRRGLDDADKGPLIFEYLRLLGELRPRAFVMENVKGLLSAPKTYHRMPPGNNGRRIAGVHGVLLEEFLAGVRALGYSCEHRLLNAADYGVPQVRNRVFFVGFRDGRAPSFPKATHSAEGGRGLHRWNTLGSVIRPLKDDGSFRNKFSPRKLKYLRMVPEGGNWRHLPEAVQRESMGRAFFAKGGRTGYWRRLAFDQPCPTLLTEPQNASTSLCHPKLDRPLTVREYARVQTFPDDWKICGGGMEQYRMMGNAVPVLLAAHVAGAVGADLCRPAEARRVARLATC